MNFIRSRLALEKIPIGAMIEVDLDLGEPEQMVAEGLRGEGHAVTAMPHPSDGSAVRLLITRRGL